jgi:hypothetical protein
MDAVIALVLTAAVGGPAAYRLPTTDYRLPTTDYRLSIVGAWTLNRDVPEPPEATGEPGGERGRGRGRDGQGGGHGFGGGGRGGFGGGFGGGGAGRDGRGGGGREGMARRMEAMRDVFEAPQRLTITATESMVIITTNEGRTTRLSLDGKKIKDEATGIERKTKWEGDKLVTEITGAGPGKITQTLELDPEHHQLVLAVQSSEQSRNGSGGTRRHVYDPDPGAR